MYNRQLAINTQNILFNEPEYPLVYAIIDYIKDIDYDIEKTKEHIIGLEEKGEYIPGPIAQEYYYEQLNYAKKHLLERI